MLKAAAGLSPEHFMSIAEQATTTCCRGTPCTTATYFLEAPGHLRIPSPSGPTRWVTFWTPLFPFVSGKTTPLTSFTSLDIAENATTTAPPSLPLQNNRPHRLPLPLESSPLREKILSCTGLLLHMQEKSSLREKFLSCTGSFAHACTLHLKGQEIVATSLGRQYCLQH